MKVMPAKMICEDPSKEIKVSFQVKPLPLWLISGCCLFSFFLISFYCYLTFYSWLGLSETDSWPVRFLENSPRFWITFLWWSPCLIYLGFMALFYLLLYKVWRSLEPLNKLRKKGMDSPRLIPPGMAVGFCFIPWFTHIWFFIVLGRIAPVAKEYAALLQRSYRGPSRWFFWSMAVLSLFSFYFVIFLYIESELKFLIWEQGVSSALVFFLCLGARFCLYAYVYICFVRMNRIVANLGTVEFWVKKDTLLSPLLIPCSESLCQSLPLVSSLTLGDSSSNEESIKK